MAKDEIIISPSTYMMSKKHLKGGRPVDELMGFSLILKIARLRS